MNIRLACLEDSQSIDRYIERSDSASFYHKYAWGEVIENSFGHKSYYLICIDDNGSLGGILPMVHLKSLIFGNFMVSMPYFNYGGVCADNEVDRDHLIGEAIKIAKGLDARHIEFRQEESFNNGFPYKLEKVSMRLHLSRSQKELWNSFSSKLRSQIKVPQKNGIYARIGGIEELDNFYKVFSVNMSHLGTPVYPKRFFRNILEKFPHCTSICSAFQDEIPVASGFLVGFKNMLEIPWASSLRKYNRLSANMLLYWTALQFACEKGFTVFDFGRSTPGEGTFKFKEQWGATPSPMRWHYWLRNNGAIPEITPRNPKYRIAIELWKKLPIPVTRFLGPHIIKNIP
jgi:FemAB-related protein (PEP-CTERM system-associated)